MKMSNTITSISKALLQAQKNIGKATKSESNPFFKSTYADLPTVMEVVKAPLNEAGITVLQGVGISDSGEDYVETVLLHESGEFISETMRITLTKVSDPQAQGSAISYAKRYSLQSLLFVPSVDDDGEKAMGRNPKKSSSLTGTKASAADLWANSSKVGSSKSTNGGKVENNLDDEF
jgi:hypothetical protein